MKRILAVVMVGLSALSAASPRLLLREGWALEASARAGAPGEVLSTQAYHPDGWYPATVPTTVVGALAAAKAYPDPYTGMNLRSIAGTTYPVASNFSNLPMPPESPFRSSWWFRKEFTLPMEFAGRTQRLHFDGINFRANVWLNGQLIASSDRLAGAWRIFELDVSRATRPGAVNTLAVEVFPPRPEDLSITFVDWNPMPADKDMGLWRDVWLEAAGPVAVRWPHVVTRLLPGRAELTVVAELHNDSDEPVKGVLKGSIEARTFQQEVQLRPREVREVVFAPLDLKNPRLWWPVRTGPQNLYPLDLAFEAGGKVSDRASIRFGVREVTANLDAAGHRLFRINGKNILIRGAGYTFDLLLRNDPRKREAELDYVRDMNLNAIRLEGKLEDDAFLDLCDRYGILVLAGWCCCDSWEHWSGWKAEDRFIADESLKDQIRRLRSHPSVLNWMNGSDNPPPPEVERGYLNILEGMRWPGGIVSSATQKVSPLTGPSGVKMTGPYEYVAPGYWLQDGGKRGGAHGFNTETCPGPAVPPIESLRSMLGPDHLWPVDAVWDYHAGGGPFRDIKVFTEALDSRFGPSRSAEEFAGKAQVLAYETHRAMFEAFGRNKYESTGVIQWMLNNAWPSTIWHLYDWYLRPGGSYFGTKKACEPLHVQYSYDDASVVVVNSLYRAFPGLQVRARIFDLEMNERFHREATLSVGEDSSTRAFLLPAVKGLTGPYFLRLDLTDASGCQISSNLYWLSPHMDEMDWDRSTWYHTPSRSFADFKALQTLPRVALKVACHHEAQGAQGLTRVTVENPSRTLAFFIRLKVDRPDGEEILPVLWEDNYFSLLPGEKREISASYSLEEPSGVLVDATDGSTREGGGRIQRPQLEVDGWNIEPLRPRIDMEDPQS